MKNNTLVILFLFWLSFVASQENYIKLPLVKEKGATYIINDDIIGNENLFIIENITKEDIVEVTVLKDKSNQSQPYYNLSAEGVLFVKIKKDLECKTQEELNQFFGLDPKNEIYIDGYLLSDSKYRVAVKSIMTLDLVAPNKINGLKNTVLNIWTLPKENQ